jgi:hypothetical protein
MNRDGQMCELLTIQYPEFGLKFKSVAFGDGLPASAKWVREGILAKYEGGRRKDEGKRMKYEGAEGRRMKAEGKKTEGKKVRRPITKTVKTKTAKTAKTAKKTSAKRR